MIKSTLKSFALLLVIFVVNIYAAKISGTGGFWLGMTRAQAGDETNNHKDVVWDDNNNAYTIGDYHLPGSLLPSNLYVEFNSKGRVNCISVVSRGTPTGVLRNVVYNLMSKFGKALGSWQKYIPFVGNSYTTYWKIEGRSLVMNADDSQYLSLRYHDSFETRKFFRNRKKQKSQF